MKRKVKHNLTGQRFGRLIVLEQADDHIKPSGQHETMWKCSCTCGGIKDIRASVLKNGMTQSCGCLFTETLQLRNSGNTYGKKSPNDTIIEGNCVKILFSDSTYTLVDLDVYKSKLAGLRIFKSSDGYATVYITQEGGRKQIRLHHLVLGTTASEIAPKTVDHINRNKLDNRKDNLRVVSITENNWNRDLPLNKLGCHCVEFTGSTYRVRVSINGQTISLGSFETQQEAEDCYSKFVAENRQILG